VDELIDFVPTTCCPELGSSNAKYLVDPKLGDWWVGIVSGVSGAGPTLALLGATWEKEGICRSPGEAVHIP